MAKKHKAGPGPCVHCLAEVAERTWDHVFPRAWYPDTTPENLEKWKFPACEPCNASYGALEQDLLLRVGLGLDSARVEASGIPTQVLRAMDPATAHNDKDRLAREARRRQILSETFPVGPEHHQAIIPGFGPRPNASPIGIGIPQEWLERLVEKLARGLTFLQTGRLITAACTIESFIDPEHGAICEEVLTRIGHRDERGPGITVQYAIARKDGGTSFFSVVFWATFHLWGVVRPVTPAQEEAAGDAHAVTRADGTANTLA